MCVFNSDKLCMFVCGGCEFMCGYVHSYVCGHLYSFVGMCIQVWVCVFMGGHVYSFVGMCIHGWVCVFMGGYVHSCVGMCILLWELCIGYLWVFAYSFVGIYNLSLLNNSVGCKRYLSIIREHFMVRMSRKPKGGGALVFK